MDSKQAQSIDPRRPGTSFSEAVEIMARLRELGGCPWDREQDFNSIRKYTLEETYEVLDAIERRDWPHLKDELGDLLLQVLFYAQMASEATYFTITDVIDGLNRKLIRRHPHVFGDAASAAAGNVAPGLKIDGIDAAQVLRNWDEIKAAEKPIERGQKMSRLDSVPRSLPAMLEAGKLGSRAAKCGFDWPEVEGLFSKLAEETTELREAMENSRSIPDANKQRDIEGEVGDLLFTMVNLARRLKVDPEMALRGTNAKFRGRFQLMENAAKEPLESLSLEELDELWTAAKKNDVGWRPE
jgi:nucleoside triphosphate diphosphatase